MFIRTHQMLVNMEMDNDNPENAPLIESYLKSEDKALFEELKQLGQSGQLTFDQYSEYHRLRDGALEELGRAAGKIVLAKYYFDYESSASSEAAL